MRSGASNVPLISCLALLLMSAHPDNAWPCQPPTINREATPEEVRAFFRTQRKAVVTFLGYSAAEYEDRAALMRHAAGILAQLDPAKTIVNIGGTSDGIGAVYEVAKEGGYTTSGIASTQARESKAAISPCVDVLFFVKDELWGGLMAGTNRLSPTSAAMVDVSDRFVAIGGGDVTRDELTAARQAGKDVRFIPADMNHRIARERALERGEPPPGDFRGSAAAVFGSGG
jgi:predicted Rossmann-fold nucleotide-binding protein